MTRPRRSLDGLHVVVARTDRAMDHTIAEFEARGARVTPAVTATRAGPSDGGRALLDALTRPPSGWLVLASAAAVDAVIATGADVASWRGAALGPATARAATDAGIHVELIAEPATARRLVAMLGDLDDTGRLVAPVVENEPSVLAAELGASPLVDRGEVVPAYRSERGDLRDLGAEIATADLVIAFAPSAVRRLARAGRPRHLLAIGPTTADPAAEWLGAAAVTVAEHHDLDGVIHAAEQWWAARNDLGSAP